MRHIPAALRRFVIKRAANRCEYCGLSQEGQAATFHIDHVVPIAAGGETLEDNLALSCAACSLYKGARREVRDPETGQLTPLFNPRRQEWATHFVWDGPHLVGLTPAGRATVHALKMNRPVILAIRAEEAHFDRHPPPVDSSPDG